MVLTSKVPFYPACTGVVRIEIAILLDVKESLGSGVVKTFSWLRIEPQATKAENMCVEVLFCFLCT